MAVGQGAAIASLSYLAIGRELTYGTYNTCTAGLNFLSASLKITKDVKILEEVQTSRTNSNYVQLGKSLSGDMEFYFSPINAACNYILQNAFGGGAVTTATATGETVGGLGFKHTIDINNFLTTYSSLCINMRKGDATAGKVFQYQGLRVNELTFSAEIDDALKCSASLIGQDATAGSDVSSVLTTLTQNPLSFVNGRFSIETTTAGLTTTSFWHVQSFEFKLANDLKSDTGSRRIGTDTIQVLPPGLATTELKCTIRFDTTTAYDAMIAGTRFAAEFEFLGNTMASSAAREGLKLTMPFVVISEAGDPEVGGPSDILTSEVSFKILRDPTTSGYMVKAIVTNNTSTYA